MTKEEIREIEAAKKREENRQKKNGSFKKDLKIELLPADYPTKHGYCHWN